MNKELVKKSLHLMVVSIIVSIVAVVFSLIGACVGFGSADAGAVIILISSIIVIVAGIISLVALYNGKCGGVEKFGIAFWVAIAGIIVSVISFIFALIPNCAPVATAFMIISAACSAVQVVFECLGLIDIVPSNKNLAFATLICWGVGIILNAIPVGAVSIIGAIISLAAAIMQIILVFKTQKEYN